MSMTSGAGKIRVLILDDDEGFLRLCREYFQRENLLDADYVSSPTEALEMVSRGNYQIVVSDHTLPGMDGMQFLSALRSMHHDLPFIMITGNGREGLAIEAVQNGADVYMEKAGTPSSMFGQLIEIIKSLGNVSSLIENLPETFHVFSQGGVLFINNRGERVLAAQSRA
ncbi:MAG: response regulator [Methanomassiliicoccales archaeon]|nr:response regulator [Methanomassiliicoccales archaeon]